jgi:hypothetical protein
MQVPSTLLLCCLHDALQAVFGWTDSHPHQFEKNGKYWGLVQSYEDEQLDVLEEGTVALAKVLRSECDSVIYVYDFGDNWHKVVLEKIPPAEIALRYSVCLAG